MKSFVGRMKSMFPFVATAVLFFGAFFLLNSSPELGDCAEENAHSGSHEIVFTPGGVLPPCLKLFSGEIVVWVNSTEKTVQVATDPHPAHTGNRELSGGDFVLPLYPGERKGIRLNAKGEFGYHDHFNPAAHGTLIVE